MPWLPTIWWNNVRIIEKISKPHFSFIIILGWNDFVVEYSREYFSFFQDWFLRFKNPRLTICFEEMVEDPGNSVKQMLDFLEFPDFRLDCIYQNLEGEFHREHHASDAHIKLYTKTQQGTDFNTLF